MNMRKTYKQSMALGLDEKGLRRWCNDLILNGPDDKVGAALAILEELDGAVARKKAEEAANDKLSRALRMIDTKKHSSSVCPRCNGTGELWSGVGQCSYDCPECTVITEDEEW